MSMGGVQRESSITNRLDRKQNVCMRKSGLAGQTGCDVLQLDWTVRYIFFSFLCLMQVVLIKSLLRGVIN